MARAAQAAPAAPAVRALTCPSCGGTVTLRAAGYTVTVACEYCGSILDVTNPEVRLITEDRQGEGGGGGGGTGDQARRAWEPQGSRMGGGRLSPAFGRRRLSLGRISLVQPVSRLSL